MRNGFWTPARVARLTHMWSAGKTAAAIGADLGGISRSAVLGKVFRLRLVAQDDVPADAPARRRAGKAKPIQPQPTKCKTLLELTNECCRWPHGDLGGRRFFFCGVPEADLARGIPYCPRHMQRAYLIPPSLLTPLHKLKLIVSGGQNKAKGVKRFLAQASDQHGDVSVSGQAASGQTKCRTPTEQPKSRLQVRVQCCASVLPRRRGRKSAATAKAFSARSASPPRRRLPAPAKCRTDGRFCL